MKKTLLLMLGAVISTQLFAGKISGSIWSQQANRESVTGTQRTWLPSKFKTMALDITSAKQQLQGLPMERTTAARNSSFTMDLPTPDGNFLNFRIWETQVMHPDLAAKFPMMKTFAGQGINDPSAKVFFDYTQFGFHAMVMTDNGWYYIEPVDLTTETEYLVYYRKDIGHGPSFDCGVTSESDIKDIDELVAGKGGNNNTVMVGNSLRDYRLALACTGEYAAYYGGTVTGAAAGMLTSVNRVDGIYETEMCISLTLIANNNLLIYTNANTDPYTNNNGSTMLGQNQTTVTSVIGSANYDIGHVFSTGGGGIANLGCVCSSGNKARGVTGSTAPVGDGYDVDYVAHEMGHQFSGNHSFNSQTGSCGGGNRNANTAYEPGSGITIMGYAGICGSDDLAAHSIAYFHLISLAEINTFTTTGGGSTCPVSTPTGNNAPTIATLGTWIIPYQTPFRLTATGSDPDGDPIYYTWEEYDKGPAGAWNAPSGDAPIYRSYAPDTSATRIFPKLNYVLSNTTGKGELKPTYARTLKFKCTIRDKKTGGGGWIYNANNVTVQCINTGTGFAVTYPNVTGITWAQNSQQTVTWNVAQSDVAPISTPTVNILLSTDGGYHFTVTLASGVPNNGSAVITVPNNVSSSQCRIMVEGAGNVFFDINDKNLAISPASISDNELQKGIEVFPNPANDLLNINIQKNLTGNLYVKLFDQNGKLVSSELLQLPVATDSYKMDISKLSKGIYSLRFESDGGTYNQKVVKL